jgi:hypothetical protein
MARVEKEKTAEVGDFLSRHMSVRWRTAQRGAIGLAYLLQHGGGGLMKSTSRRRPTPR